MSIICTGDTANGNSYMFDSPPAHWKIPPGFTIKMDKYPGTTLAEVVPTKYEKSWGGEGIPPVGTVCEYVDWSGITRTVEVLAYSNDEAWLRSIGKECAIHSFTTKYLDKFQVIRTPEQVAAEERDKAINQMEFDTGYLDRGAFTKLYDAGWRKVTP